MSMRKTRKVLKILPVLFYGTGVIEWFVALSMAHFQMWFIVFLNSTAMLFGAGVIPLYRTWKRKRFIAMYLTLPVLMILISILCQKGISLFVGIMFGIGELFAWYFNL